jgi:hypothetical protein
MAKRRSRKRKGASTGEIERAVHQLQEYHGLGRRLLREHPPGKKHNKETLRLEAAENGIHWMKVFHIRGFADEEKGYSDEELEALIDLCWEHHCALGFSFVPKFLSIRDKAKRGKFQQAAIRGRWSLTTVERELVKQFGRRRQAGRSADVPNEPRDLYADLKKRAIYWGRLKKLLQKKPDPGSSRLQWSELPKEIRDLLGEAVEGMEKLENALDGLLPKPKKPKRATPA